MQRGIGLLALCCTIGFGLSIVFAEEPFFEKSNTRTIEYFSRNGETAKASIPAKSPTNETSLFDNSTGAPPFVMPLPSRYERSKSSAEQLSKMKSTEAAQQANYFSDRYPWSNEETRTGQSAPQQYRRTVKSLPGFDASQNTNIQPNNLKAFVPQLSELNAEPTTTNQPEQLTDWNPKLKPLQEIKTARPQIIQTASQEMATKKPSPLELILAEYEELESDTGKQKIQQITATEENTTPFSDAPPAKQLPLRTLDPSAIKTGAVDNTTQHQAVTPVPTIAQLGKNNGVPHIALEWVKRSAINVGQECECDLLIKNNSEHNALELTVKAYFPTTVQLLKTEPKPVDARGHLTWNITALHAGQTKTIHVHFIPNKRGELETTAVVHLSGSATSQFTVEEPMLKIAVKGPKDVLLGDPATQIVSVSNPGTGTAHNVKLNAFLPSGLEHSAGSKVSIDVGSLHPGESRQIRLAIAATGGGSQKLLLQAQADHNLTSRTETEVSVIAPNLKIDLAGPSLRYKGRIANYRLVITNNGTAPSNNVRASHKLPKGFRFVKADGGGSFDSSNNTIDWYLGRLDVGAAKTLNIVLEATDLGDYKHLAQAYSDHGSRTQAELATRVDGTASLVLEIVDLNDPVEVGVETAYEIRLRNDGSKSATQVGISCELPEGVELVGAKGPVESIGEKGYVIFKSLKELPAGKTALYHIKVRGKEAGHQRFRVRLVSDSIKEPLIYEELTKFYSDKL